MILHRAYSVCEVKRLGTDADSLTIEGIASTPTPDRVGDSINPMGAKFQLPMPLLDSHRHDLPVGKVVYAAPTMKGIPFTARLPRVKSPGKLKDRIDLAIHSLEAGLIAAVSVGFSAKANKTKQLPGGGSEYLEWDWHELSICTIPCNSEAVIHTVKSLGPASNIGRLSPDLIHQIKLAEYRSLRAGVPLVSSGPRAGVKLLQVQR